MNEMRMEEGERSSDPKEDEQVSRPGSRRGHVIGGICSRLKGRLLEEIDQADHFPTVWPRVFRYALRTPGEARLRKPSMRRAGLADAGLDYHQASIFSH